MSFTLSNFIHSQHTQPINQLINNFTAHRHSVNGRAKIEHYATKQDKLHIEIGSTVAGIKTKAKNANNRMLSGGRFNAHEKRQTSNIRCD